MNSRVILAVNDTAPFMPDAGVIRGYEDLRRTECGGLVLLVFSRVYASEWVRMWCEDDRIYAMICFDGTDEEILENVKGYAELKKTNPPNDHLVITPCFPENKGIGFAKFEILQTISMPDDRCVMAISASKYDVFRYEHDTLYLEKDLRKFYLDSRKYGQASKQYMYNIRGSETSYLWRSPMKDGKQILPDNEYAEILANDDKIAKQTLQEMKQEDPECDYIDEAFNALHIYKGAKDPYKELDEMEGLDEIKENVSILAKKLRYFKNRKARGKINNVNSNMHMCFMGSPGTGKTTLARIMVGILYEMGMIEHNEFVEIAATDLKAKYANQTSKKTEFVIRSAYDRVLFIDEAYALASDDKNDNGKEAITEILKQMEDNRERLIIIFAGYQQDMERFLDMNIGFRSRINRYYVFRDFSAFECTQMVLRKFENAYSFNKNAVFKLHEYFEQASCTKGFGNVRTVKMVCKKMVENWAYRTTYEGVSEHEKYIIEEEDILRIS